MLMKIGIIGAGSIGLLFSYYLNEKHQVTVYTRTKRQAELIQVNGVHLIEGSTTKARKVKADPIEFWNGDEDLTIITVKQYQLPSIISLIDKQLKMQGSLLFLQNGMVHLRFLSELKVSNVFLGAVQHGAVRVNEYTVSHNGNGGTRVAVYRGEETHLKGLIGSVPEGFQMELKEDYFEMLQSKLIVNAIINPLTATFQVSNGALLHNQYLNQITISLFEEIAAVLNIHNREEQFANVLSVCKKTSENKSSMLMDIESGRDTEIDAILGYVLEEAERKQIPAPLTRNYYNLIKGKELKRRRT